MDEYSNFIDIIKSDESKVWGFVDDKNALIRNLSNIGYSYSVRSSTKLGFQVFSKWKKNDIYISLGCLFRKNEFIVYNCVHGPHRNKNTNKQEDRQMAKKTRVRLLGSKKQNCPAVMKIMSIISYPSYKVKEDSAWTFRKKMIKELENDKNAESKTCFYIVLSLPDVHNHSKLTTYMKQPVSEEVKRIIKAQVDKGNINVTSVKRAIESRNGDTDAPLIARSCFPDNRTIYNYILKYSRLNKCSKIDQHIDKGVDLQNHTKLTSMKQPVRADVKSINKTQVDKDIKVTSVRHAIESHIGNTNAPSIDRNSFPDNSSIYNYKIDQCCDKSIEDLVEIVYVEDDGSCYESHTNSNTIVEDIQNLLNTMTHKMSMVKSDANIANLNQIKHGLEILDNSLTTEIIMDTAQLPIVKRTNNSYSDFPSRKKKKMT